MKGMPDGIYLEVELENRKVKLMKKHIRIEETLF